MEFKKLSAVDTVETVSDAANVLIEENGVIKRAPKDEVGGVKVAHAEVGQTIVVKAVDGNGVPTEWECANVCGYDLILKQLDGGKGAILHGSYQTAMNKIHQCMPISVYACVMGDNTDDRALYTVNIVKIHYIELQGNEILMNGEDSLIVRIYPDNTVDMYFD